MKTELCWNRTKIAKGQACRSLAGNLTVQRPRSQTTGAKVQHHNKALGLPVLTIGTFEDKHSPSRCCSKPGGQSCRFCGFSSAVILTSEMEETQRSTKRDKQNKRGQ